MTLYQVIEQYCEVTKSEMLHPILRGYLGNIISSQWRIGKFVGDIDKDEKLEKCKATDGDCKCTVNNYPSFFVPVMISEIDKIYSRLNPTPKKQRKRIPVKQESL